jgi:small conductance mechanosensitive channel
MIRLLLAALMFLIFYLIIKIVTTTVGHVINNPKKHILDERLAKFTMALLKVMLWMQVVPMLVNQIQIGVESVVAFIGAISLSIGLSVRDVAMNLSYGVVLIFDKPFQLGDLVEAAGEKGIIREMGLISTSLLKPDGRLVQLTNTQVFSKPIINFTKYGKIRLECKFKLVYGCDLLRVREICQSIVRKSTKVLDDSPVTVLVRDLTETGVAFIVRYYVLPEDQLSAIFEVNELVLTALLEAGVKFTSWPCGLGQSIKHLANAGLPGLDETMYEESEDLDDDMKAETANAKSLVDEAAAGATL